MQITKKFELVHLVVTELLFKCYLASGFYPSPMILKGNEVFSWKILFFLNGKLNIFCVQASVYIGLDQFGHDYPDVSLSFASDYCYKHY